MKRIFLVLPVLLLISLFAFFQGCSKDDVVSPSALTDATCPPFSTPIYAGQTIEVGALIVSNDANNLYVTYQFNSPYYANTMQMWAGCNIDNAPRNSQNVPQPGQFPYKTTNGGANYTFTIPLSSISDCGAGFGCPNNPANIYILAHADVLGSGGFSETGWSFTGNTSCGKSFADQWGTSRWGWFTCYTICCDPFNQNPPPETGSETAFAKLYKASASGQLGGYVFAYDSKANPEGYPSLQLTKNRWGWAAKLNESIITSTGLSFELWAGAGLNKTSNGTLVGNVTLTKSGSDLVITYSTTGLYTFSEVHIYLDNGMPTTIAPGQYGNTYSYNPPVNNQAYTFPMPTGDFWFIGHAVVQIPVTP